jgi:hypothetical protein
MPEAQPNIQTLADFYLQGRWLVKNPRIFWEETDKGYKITFAAESDAPQGLLDAYFDARIKAIFERLRPK